MSTERVHRFNLGANLGFSRHDCPNCGPEALHKHAVCATCGALWTAPEAKVAAAKARKAWSLKKAEDQGARIRKARAKAVHGRS